MNGSRITCSGQREALTISHPIRQVFQVTQPNLNVIALPVANRDGLKDCAVRVALRDLRAGRLLVERQIVCAEIRGETPVLLGFPPQPASNTQIYELSVSNEVESAQGRLIGFSLPAAGSHGGYASGGQVSPAGSSSRLFAGTVGGLERVWRSSPFSIFQVPGSPPRFRTVANAVHVQGDEQALRVLESTDFDVASTILVQDAAITGGSGAPGWEPVAIEEDLPGRVRLRAERRSPGWLFAYQSFFPGWTATVNGEPRPLVRANVGFTAIRLDAGTSEIVLQYDPLSFKLGVAFTLLTSACIIATVVFAVREQRAGGLRRALGWAHPRPDP